jgi:Ni/Co efflux regulator RcnB
MRRSGEDDLMNGALKTVLIAGLLTLPMMASPAVANDWRGYERGHGHVQRSDVARHHYRGDRRSHERRAPYRQHATVWGHGAVVPDRGHVASYPGSYAPRHGYVAPPRRHHVAPYRSSRSNVSISLGWTAGHYSPPGSSYYFGATHRSGRPIHRGSIYSTPWSAASYGHGYGYGSPYSTTRYAYAPVQAFHGGWRVGDRLPRSYLAPAYFVDYRTHRLSVPPRGHHWVRVDNDFVLVALATGLIAHILGGMYY